MNGLQRPSTTFADMNFLTKFGQHLLLNHALKGFQRKGLKEEDNIAEIITRSCHQSSLDDEIAINAEATWHYFTHRKWP